MGRPTAVPHLVQWHGSLTVPNAASVVANRVWCVDATDGGHALAMIFATESDELYRRGFPTSGRFAIVRVDSDADEWVAFATNPKE